MKRFLLLTIAFLLVMLPFTSFTGQVISDDELDKVTAEEGVTIGFDNFSLTGSSAAGTFTMLGDSDGHSGYATAGYTGATDISITGNVVQMSGNMVLDVGTSGSRTAVAITLPTVTLGRADISTVMKMDSSVNLSGGKKLGVLDLRGLSMEVKSDSIQIFAH